MPTYIEITSAVNHIYIKFNDLQNNPNVTQKDWSVAKGFLSDIQHELDDSLTLRMVTGREHRVCAITALIPNCLPIQSVDGVTPTSNEHLHELFNAIL